MNTAVILAARRERDSEIPYPLLPFYKDLCLLDRTLIILRELNFDNIIIVVGYKSEMFKKYIAADVTLVENKEYEFTSSMGSLACVEGYVHDDFLLLESDTFYERKVIEDLSLITQGNCVSMTEECGSGDECFIETKSGFITKITKDRHSVCHFEGEMIGVSRISIVTFQELLKAWRSASNPYLNYEYLFMDVTESLDRPVMMFKNLIWGDVDNKFDFHKLQNEIYPKLRRRENPFDHDNLIMHVQSIFPEEDVTKAIFTQIGGMSNKNFKVDFYGRSYVLRVPGNGSDGMVERKNEEFNALQASKLGVNPQIRFFDASTGIKFVDFVKNAETLNAATIQRHENMRKIARIYKKIHSSQIRLKNEFNIFSEIEKYNSLLIKAGASMYAGFEDVRPKVLALEDYLNQLGVKLCPCHNDGLFENFIKSEEGKIYLIDWEYSGMNDPMADLASLFLEANFTIENQDFVLNEYFDGSLPSDVSTKILCYQILWDYLWAQWTLIKEAHGDDFGTYGEMRFVRACNNLNKIYS